MSKPQNILHVRPSGRDWEAYENEVICPRFFTKKQAIEYAEQRSKLSGLTIFVYDEDGQLEREITPGIGQSK